MDEAEFRYSNGIVIDTEIEKERIEDVLKHEFTHSQTYAKSTFGQLFMMLDKNALFDERSRILRDGLFPYLSRMQEQVAINVELLNKCSKEGIPAYKKAIEDLKMRNNSYYNHFRKLCCINGRVDSGAAAETLADLLENIAYWALNVDLSQINFERLKSEKDIKRFIEKPENIMRFSPNKRFDLMVNHIFRNNNKSDGISTLIEDLDENFFDIERIHDEAMKALEKIYVNNPLKARLLRRADSIGAVGIPETEGVDKLLTQPMNLNDSNKLERVFLSNEDEFINQLNSSSTRILYVMKNLRGFEDIQALAFRSEENDRKINHIFGFQDDNHKILFRILNRIEGKVVFYNINLMYKEWKSVRKIVRQVPIYIYMDVTLAYYIEKINKMFFGGKYTYIQEEKKTIFAVEKKSIVLFANIVKDAEEVLDGKLEMGKIRKIPPADFPNNEEVTVLDHICAQYEEKLPR